MIRPVQKDLYAVIGNPVDHSLSPVMMNAVFEALKIPAVYLALQVDDLAEDLTTLSRLGVKGLSVTIPHKESALPSGRKRRRTIPGHGSGEYLAASGHPMGRTKHRLDWSDHRITRQNGPLRAPSAFRGPTRQPRRFTRVSQYLHPRLSTHHSALISVGRP